MALDRLLGMTVFRRAVELGSLAAAGRATGVSAEMAGQHLKGLETRLGVRLLSRTTRRLSLTEAGQAYYQRCVAALEEIALADAEAGARQAAPSGRLRVTAPLGFANAVLAPLVSLFLDMHPHCISFYIRFGDRGRRVPLASVVRASTADRSEMHPRW